MVETSPRTSFPEQIGRYELLLPIARGGMATVYLGRMRGIRGFEREVAVKVMHPHLSLQGDDADLAGADLIEEAKLAARIRHPNVVPVLDVGEDPHGIFLVMDYVEGESLEAILRLTRTTGEQLPMPIALRILSDAFAGLHAAHELCDAQGAELGLVHRDFSPHNILVGIDGVAKLTDFGIAKATNRDGATRTGVVKGKAGYMSPEQARAQVLDRRSDVWAAGVVAWEVFAGRRLFAHGDPVATALAIVTQRAPRLKSVVSDVPSEADEAIAAALMRERERRLPSVAELGRRLVAAWETELASRAEVARYVTRLAGERIAARRERAQEILERRQPAASWVADAHASMKAEPVAQTEATTLIAKPRPRASRWISVGLGALIAGGLGLAALQRGLSAEAPQPKEDEPKAGEPARVEASTAPPVAMNPPVASGSAVAPPTSSTAGAPHRTPAPKPPVKASATPLGPSPYEEP